MMVYNKKLQRVVSLLVLLKFLILQCTLVYPLSISSGNTKNNITNSIKGNHYQQQYHGHSSLSQQVTTTGQQPPFTTIPPLITTISQNNYIDSIVQQVSPQPQPQITQSQPHQQLTSSSIKQQQQLPQAAGSQEPLVSHSPGELRSSNVEEHDEPVPTATINNHSRNNQPAPRPPQYVDVSALIGRNASSVSSSSGLISGGGSSSSVSHYSSSGSAGLSGKSRSGLPECATQQVCNAIFVRMNYTQKLCECSSNYNWKCSNNLDAQDGHTIELTRKFDKRIYTQIKTCEPLRDVRACKSPTDWTLLALQSERSGKAHYVVVCKCPTWAQLEGPYTHNHPPYANIPGIRVYGMLCAHQTARSSAQSYATYNPALSIYPEFPWSEALNVLNTTNLLPTLNFH